MKFFLLKLADSIKIYGSGTLLTSYFDGFSKIAIMYGILANN